MPAIRNGEQLLLVSGGGDMTVGYGGLVDDTSDANELVVNIATETHKVGDLTDCGSLRERTESAVLRMQFGSLESLEVFLAQAIILWHIMAEKEGVPGDAIPLSYIQAANEMYEALQTLVHLYDHLPTTAFLPRDWHPALAATKTALAKARGEATDASH